MPVTYYVALPFHPDEGGAPVAGDGQEAQSAHAATRLASALATTSTNCGAVAFSRTGDPMSGEFEDAKLIASYGVVDAGAFGG